MELITLESRQHVFETDQYKATCVLRHLPHSTDPQTDVLILAYAVTHVLDLVVGSTNYDLVELRRLVVERAVHILRQDGYTV